VDFRGLLFSVDPSCALDPKLCRSLRIQQPETSRKKAARKQFGTSTFVWRTQKKMRNKSPTGIQNMFKVNELPKNR
jgi:hypothetical protein